MPKAIDPLSGYMMRIIEIIFQVVHSGRGDGYVPWPISWCQGDNYELFMEGSEVAMRPQPCHSETWKDSAGVMSIGCFQASFHVQLFATYGFSVDVKGDHVTLTSAIALIETEHGEV